MKKFPAIALLEFRDIAVGIHATDALIKKAPIAVVQSGTISHGRYLTLIGGSTASVQEAHQEGLLFGKDSVIDHVYLPDVHPRLLEGVLGKRSAGHWFGALGIVETRTVACNVRATELALKATEVDLIEIRISDAWLAGKGMSLYHGELYDVEAAVETAVSSLEATHSEVMHRIVTSPHEGLTQQLSAGTHFIANTLLDLDGETG